MRLEVVARARPLRSLRMLSPVLAFLCAMLASAVLFAVLGKDPLASLAALLVTPLASLDGLSEIGLKATPLLLCAIGIAIGCAANVWNIGAEGQFTLGAVCGTAPFLAFGEQAGAWLLPLMLICGVLGGMAWAAIAAFLRTRFNAHEILTTLMLTYIALQGLGFLVHGPWKDPAGFNFPQTPQFDANATLPVLIEGSRLNLAALFAVLAVPLATLLLGRTLIGFRIRVVGLAPEAARYAGFSSNATVWFTLLLSGGLAGLAGICEVTGPIGQLQPVISPGYGFAAIIVAFLGRLHPVGILLASLLMALLYIGGEGLQMSLQLPLAVTQVIQGMLLFFLLAADFFIQFRLRLTSTG